MVLVLCCVLCRFRLGIRLICSVCSFTCVQQAHTSYCSSYRSSLRSHSPPPHMTSVIVLRLWWCLPLNQPVVSWTYLDDTDMSWRRVESETAWLQQRITTHIHCLVLERDVKNKLAGRWVIWLSWIPAVDYAYARLSKMGLICSGYMHSCASSSSSVWQCTWWILWFMSGLFLLIFKDLSLFPIIVSLNFVVLLSRYQRAQMKKCEWLSEIAESLSAYSHVSLDCFCGLYAERKELLLAVQQTEETVRNISLFLIQASEQQKG